MHAQQNGQLEVRINTEAYLHDGRFDQDRMLAAFEQMASGNAKGGFPLSRICCRMDWAVDDRSYIDDLVEFESRVNHVWRSHDDAVICTYQLGKFGGDTVIDIMRTHPMMIIGGLSAPESVLCAARGIPAGGPPAAGHAVILNQHGGLIWKCNLNLLPEKSSIFNGA